MSLPRLLLNEIARAGWVQAGTLYPMHPDYREVWRALQTLQQRRLIKTFGRGKTAWVRVTVLGRDVKAGVVQIDREGRGGKFVFRFPDRPNVITIPPERSMR